MHTSLHRRTNFAALLGFVLAVVSAADAQTNDVLYLRNGSTIRGTVLSLQSGKTVRILTADSSIVEITLNAVEKIVVKPPAEREVITNVTGDVRRATFSVCAGMSLPTGSFKSTSSSDAGLAKMGFLAGGSAGIPVSEVVDVVISALYCDNPVDAGPIKSQFTGVSSIDVGSWTTLSLTAGLRLGTEISPGTRAYCGGAMGAAFVWSPYLRLHSASADFEEHTSHATSFVWTVGVGILGVGNMNIAAEYTMLTPSFNVDATVSGIGGYYKATARVEQPMNQIRITVGIGVW